MVLQRFWLPLPTPPPSLSWAKIPSLPKQSASEYETRLRPQINGLTTRNKSSHQHCNTTVKNSGGHQPIRCVTVFLLVSPSSKLDTPWWEPVELDVNLISTLKSQMFCLDVNRTFLTLTKNTMANHQLKILQNYTF